MHASYLLLKKKVDAYLLYCWAYIAQPHMIYHYHNHCFMFIKFTTVY